MPDEERVISPEQAAIADTPARATAVQAQHRAAYEPIEAHEEWLEEPLELPRRPRRRLLSPIPLALLGVLLTACGFIVGVLVEKGQTTPGSSAAATTSSLVSRFAGLRLGASGAAGASGGAGFGGGGFGGGAPPTTGQVEFLAAGTLYVTTAEGNTVKVTTTPGTTVTKTVKADVKGIHPGETVTITGASANGAISAESIRVGAGAGGGLGALFSGSGAAARGRSGGSGAGSGEPALFGGGG